LRTALVCTYVNGGGVGIISNRTLIYEQQVTLKLWLNNYILGITKLGKTQRNVGLLCAVSKVMSNSF